MKMSVIRLGLAGASLFLFAVAPQLRAAGEVVAWGYNNVGQANVPEGLSNVVAVGASGHSLALKGDGTVVAWGYNGFGETNVPAGVSGIVGIAAGSNHNLLLKSDGTVMGWGWNIFGQATVPSGLSSVVGISAGCWHSMALKRDGTVFVWGYNGYGQTNVPSGLRGVVSIAAGSYSCVALKSDGTVVAWGSQTNVPFGLSGVIAIAAGSEHTVALKRDGTVTAWGHNSHGQTNVPANLSGVIAIAAGDFHSSAVKADGTVVAWGRDFLGSATVPVGLSGVGSVAAGYDYNVVLKPYGPKIVATGLLLPAADLGAIYNQTLEADEGTAPYTWSLVTGRLPAGLALSSTGNINGRPTAAGVSCFRVRVTGADGLATERNFALIVDGPPTLVVNGQLPAGVVNKPFSLKLESEGAMTPYVWSVVSGSLPPGLVLGETTGVISGTPAAVGTFNFRVRVASDGGYATEQDYALSTEVGSVITWGSIAPPVPDGLSGIVTVAAGGGFSIALKADGTLVVWGSSSRGAIGAPAGLSGVVAIGAGAYHALALKSDGTVVAWGDNYDGQRSVPAGLSHVVAISAGDNHNLALKSDGTVVAWGNNAYGQTNVPVGLSGVVAVAAGYLQSFALKSDGTAVAWGGSYYGEGAVPSGLFDVVAIAAGGHNDLVLKADGTILGWGDRVVPVGLSGVIAISLGPNHGLVLKSDETVVAWGDNFYGQTNVPVGLSGVVSIAARGGYSMALKPYGPIVNTSGPVLPPSEKDVVYSQTLQASGGSAPYSWSVVTGRLPEGLTLSGNGNIGGTPMVAGLSCFRVRVTGSDGRATEKDFALQINGAPVFVGGSSLPSGTVNTVYNQRVETTGPMKPYVWSLVSGSLPPSLSLNDSSGIISGTPTVPGVFNFRLRVTAPGGFGSESDFSLTITSGSLQVNISPSEVVGVGAQWQVDGGAWHNSGETVSNLGVGTHTVRFSSVFGWNSPGNQNVTISDGVTATASGTYTEKPGSLQVAINPTDAVSAGAQWRVDGGAWRNNGATVSGLSRGSHTVQFKSLLGWNSPTNQEVTINRDLTTTADGDYTPQDAWMVSPIVGLPFISSSTTFSWSVRPGGSRYRLTVGTMPEGTDIYAAEETGLSRTVQLPTHGETLHVTLWSWVGEAWQKATAYVYTAYTAPPNNGTAVAWGWNYYDQGSVSPTLFRVVSISAGSGSAHNLALKSDGTVAAWGNNEYGQCNVPSGLSGVVAVSAGHFHSLALQSNGTVVAWGVNAYGPTTNVPEGLSGVVAIAAGDYHNLALKNDGTLAGWGYDGSGRATPPAGLSGVTAISAGGGHNLALKNDGTVVAWGLNHNRQANVPAGLSNVVAVAAGAIHSLALKSDGTVVAWGDNSFGQASVPVGLADVIAISGGGRQSLALKSDGTVVAWGDNRSGQSTIPAGLSGVVAIASGSDHCIALKNDPRLTVITPADGLVFTSDQVTFAWDGLADVIQYELRVGSAPGGGDLYVGVETNRTRTLQVPADGRQIHVTLSAWVSGAWQQAATNSYTAPTATKAAMKSLKLDPVLRDGSVVFTWNAGAGVSQYGLWVGSATNGSDLYAAFEPGTSRTLVLPLDGRPLYVRLWSLINGDWQYNSYAYTAPVATKAAMLSPSPGSATSGGSVTFTWDAGLWVSQYALWVGSAAEGHDLHALNVGTNLSQMLTLPTDGRALYVRLWSKIGGEWQYNDYNYNTSSGNAGSGGSTSMIRYGGGLVSMNTVAVSGGMLQAGASTNMLIAAAPGIGIATPTLVLSNGGLGGVTLLTNSSVLTGGAVIINIIGGVSDSTLRLDFLSSSNVLRVNTGSVGTLVLNTGNIVGAGTNVLINQGGTLQFGSINNGLGYLTLQGLNVSSNSAGAYLSLGGSTLLARNITINAGTLVAGGSGAIVNDGAGLVKYGAGTLQLRNTWTGDYSNLTITNGTLVFTNSLLTMTNNDALIVRGGLFGSNSLSLFTNGCVGLGVITNTYVGGAIRWTTTAPHVLTNLWSSGDSTLILGNLGAGILTYTNTLLLDFSNNTFSTIAVPTINWTNSLFGSAVPFTGGSVLNLQDGRLEINSGTTTVGQILVTNSASTLLINGGVLTSLGSVISNGVRFVVGDGTNAATLSLPLGSHTFADGLMIAANARLTNTATLAAPRMVIGASGQFEMGEGLVAVDVVTNSGFLIQSGGVLTPAFQHNAGTMRIIGGTNMGTVFLNDAGAVLQHGGGRLDVGIATNAGTWTLSGTVAANLTNFLNQGALVINGGTLTSSRLVSTNAGSVLTFNAGLLGVGGSSVSNATRFAVGDGLQSATLNLLGGAHNFAGGLFVNTNAILTGTGAITGSLTGAGVIAPGDGVGVITDDGDLGLLGGATMRMELGGGSASLYDQFDVTGLFNFGGALDVSLVNGFTPRAGDWFDLFDFSAGVGGFSSIHLPGLDPALYWNTNALYTTGVIAADKTGITSPADGSVLASDVVPFRWDPVAGATQYALWVGTTPGGHDLHAMVEPGRSRTLRLPANGSSIHARLWALIAGTWQAVNDYSYTAPLPAKAAMTSPVVGSTNGSASMTFRWDAGVGASQYALWVGSASNSADLHALLVGTNLSRTLTLPVDGRTLFVRLWSFINGGWQYNDYSYRALNAVKARFTGLGNGAALGSANVTLSWDAGAGASQYALWVGSNPGSYDLYAAVEGANLSRALTGLPTDGRRLYVRLWSLINGTWKPNDYMFTAYAAPTSRAEMLSPTNGTTFVSNPVTLNWSAGTGVSQYAFWVGSTAGSYGLWAQVVGTNRTQQLTLPLDSEPVYVRLWSLVGGTWEFNDYAYETGSGAGAKAQMTSHANGDTLAAASTVFGWSAGSGVSQYAMWAGSTPGSHDLYAAVVGTNRTQAVTLPVDGGPVYVRLWSLLGGVWKFNDYFYTAFLAP
ncbi:MAG: putative Ig domain-containing protein [Verrucomicrobia bacterium]|nr:putative Ig domain-containing protein [Verrucomicrobiota bacterium]